MSTDFIKKLSETLKSGVTGGAFILLGAFIVAARKPVVNIINQSNGLTTAPLITDGTSTEIPVYDNNGNKVTSISLPCLIYVEGPQMQTLFNAIQTGYHNVMLETSHTFSDNLIKAKYIDPIEGMKQGFFNPKDIGEYCNTISKKDIYEYSEIVVYTGKTGIYPNSTGQMVKLTNGDSYLCKGTPWLDDSTDTKQSEILDAATYQTISVPKNQVQPLTLGKVITTCQTTVHNSSGSIIYEVAEGTILNLVASPSTSTNSHNQLVQVPEINIIGFVDSENYISATILEEAQNRATHKRSWT